MTMDVDNITDKINNIDLNKKNDDNRILNIPTTPSLLQTKEWRMAQSWWAGGRKTECEIYQRNIIEQIFLKKCEKTNERLNEYTLQIQNINHIEKLNDACEWSESFDGKTIINKTTMYFNFKFICEAGGAQSRSVKDVYKFIRSQCEYCKKNKDNDIYFINILDGKYFYDRRHNFYHLSKIYDEKKVYIGDLDSFKKIYSN